SMAIRERGREIAILKAVGFKAAQVFALMLAEAFGLALAGGLIGCVGAWLVLRVVDVYKVSRGLFVSFDVTWEILALSLGVAALLGIVSCLIPAWRSIRPTVAEGLRAVD